MSHSFKATASLFPVSLLVLVSVGACQTVEEELTVKNLFKEGKYVEANALAATQAEDTPDDDAVAAVHDMTQVALHLEEGRQASYAGDLAGALNLFFRADHIAPGHPVVAEWIEKTVSELGVQSMRKASESASLGDLEDAAGHYERALVFDPQDLVAKEGIARMLLLTNHRKGMGENYYKKGMRAMRGFWLGQANADFQYNGKYAPGDARGDERREEIGMLLAEDRVLMGERFESEGLIHAARNEYRLATLLVPSYKHAQEQLDRLEIEVEAAATLREAERKTTRGELDAAEELLREGVTLTNAQRQQYKDAFNEVVDVRWQRLYDAGIDFELDSDFESAVLKYDELLQEAGSYEDTISRRKTCLGFVVLAERLYGEAKASKTAKERLRKFKQIAVFWPEYLDVSDWIAKLDKD